MDKTVLRQRERVRESVMRGEGISTPHIRCTQWDLFCLFVLKGVFIYNYACKKGDGWFLIIAFVRVSRPFAYVSNEGIKTP